MTLLEVERTAAIVVDPAARHVDVRDLQHALERVLAGHFGQDVGIARLTRRRSPYQTSAALEELDVECRHGARLRMMFKNLSRTAMLERARRVKPAFVHDPWREIEAYRSILEPAGLGTATCYGAVVDARQDRYWLFLEKVPGVELYQVGELAVWQEAARWLARMHRLFADQSVPARAPAAHALAYDADYARLWMDRACRFLSPGAVRPQVSAWVEWLARRHSAIVDRLAALPVTFIHGECYASNVLVDRRMSAVRICPVDWEMAAVGSGLLDLAALAAGHWSEEARTAIAMAYYGALQEGGRAAMSWEAFLEDLAYCRLQIAVHWLGWFGRRQPPAAHAVDWLGEAVRLAEQLRL